MTWRKQWGEHGAAKKEVNRKTNEEIYVCCKRGYAAVSVRKEADDRLIWKQLI